jgi:hypothetical protein
MSISMSVVDKPVWLATVLCTFYMDIVLTFELWCKGLLISFLLMLTVTFQLFSSYS